MRVYGDERKNHERNGVHERNVDFNSLSYQVFDFTKHRKVVLGLDIFRIRGIQTCNEASKWRDSNTFTDTKDGWYV